MLNRTVSYLMYGVIALGVLGLLSQLFKNPFGLLKSLLITAAIVGIMYFLYRRLTTGKTDRKEQLAFRKAVRQSKKRNKDRSTPIGKKNNVANMTSSKPVRKINPRRKSDAQLTVIEGKKNKKKNRVSL